MVGDTARELANIVNEFAPRLLAISESKSGERTSPGKWSAKQILGHLIDSASNNHQRFVRAQQEVEVRLAGYEQERWVEAQAYQNESWDNLVSLWSSYNRHLAHVISVVPERKLTNTCALGENDPVSLGFLITDYIRHLKHHLEQIFGGSKY